MNQLEPLPSSIEFPRKKGRWILLSVLYRFTRFFRLLIGERRTIFVLLNLNYVFWRIAYENSYRFFGQTFPNRSYGISTELISRFLPMSGTVIDIGCGGGRISAMAAEAASVVLGIDYDINCIEFAKKNNAYSNVTYKCCNLNEYIGNEKFDVAILAGVLEHIDSAQEYLVKLHKVAHRLIIEVPDFCADPLNLIRFNLGCRLYTDNDHVREYTPELLEYQLCQSKWKILYWRQQGLMITVVVESVL